MGISDSLIDAKKNTSLSCTLILLGERGERPALSPAALSHELPAPKAPKQHLLCSRLTFRLGHRLYTPSQHVRPSRTRPTIGELGQGET